MAQPEIIKDIDARVKIAGDTMTGNLIGKYFQGTWLQTTSTADLGSSPSKIAVIKDDGWIYYRTPSELANDIGLTGNYVLKTGDTMTGQLVFNNNTSNQNGYPSIKWGTIQSNTPFIGYATDQTDGTFIITSLKGTTYATGLAIGGSSQNLLYKGQIILNASNFNQYALPLTGGTLTGNLTAPQFNGYLNGIAYQSYMPYGFTRYNTTGGWGLQTGTCIVDWGESDGGDIDIRKNCPNSGQISIKVDGRFYQNEGQYMCLDTNNFSGYALPLTGGTMSGWINFASIASWPTVSGETYPINSNGLYWVGSSDWARIFYRVSASDTGNLIVQLGDDNNCNFIIENSAGTVYSTINNRGVSGAVWNDYAEYRESDITQPGRCIIENGDDTLSLSTERLQRGAEIVSDTFGFAIGETDTCKTPIAASGRVLAYGYEDREQFKSHIGYPVCSGPNGTVSIMTDEEEQLYPSRIIGYVSAVPDYEIWGTGNVKVDGRIWIRIK